VIEARRELLYLDDLANPKRWTPAEASVEVSPEVQADGHPALRLHIDVDHHKGEPNYPIGWPRMSASLRKPAETDWTAYETFEFMLMANMSRATAPKDTISFRASCPDKSNTFYRSFTSLKLNEWIPVSIPIGDIPNVKDVVSIGFHISESNYKDGDKLDFYIGGFRLARSTELGLRGMAVRTPVVYQGVGQLKVDLDVLGPAAKVVRGLPLTVRQGDKLIRQETLPIASGKQTLFIDISELKLEPGNYTLVALPDDPERKMAGEFRVVEAPWPAGEKK
jgi:hypothetical protein